MEISHFPMQFSALGLFDIDCQLVPQVYFIITAMRPYFLFIIQPNLNVGRLFVVCGDDIDLPHHPLPV